MIADDSLSSSISFSSIISIAYELCITFFSWSFVHKTTWIVLPVFNSISSMAFKFCGSWNPTASIPSASKRGTAKSFLAVSLSICDKALRSILKDLRSTYGKPCCCDRTLRNSISSMIPRWIAVSPKRVFDSFDFAITCWICSSSMTFFSSKISPNFLSWSLIVSKRVMTGSINN